MPLRVMSHRQWNAAQGSQPRNRHGHAWMIHGNPVTILNAKCGVWHALSTFLSEAAMSSFTWQYYSQESGRPTM